MESTKIPCKTCVHFKPITGGCDAFENIPDKITLGENKHTSPIEGQSNTIVYENGKSKELIEYGL